MKTENKTIEIKRGGMLALIRPTIKGDATYFVVDYRLKGKRKLIWRSSEAAAREAAAEALDLIAAGESEAAELTSTDRHVLLRAREALVAFPGLNVDDVCRMFAEANAILAGRTSVLEASREWARLNGKVLPKIKIADAVEKITIELAANKKSGFYQQTITVQLNGIAEHFQCTQEIITPTQVSNFLHGLNCAERTKRNYRDAIGFLNRWLILHGYLAKGTDWLDGVQKYSKRKHGAVEIYTVEEMQKIIAQAKKENGWRLPMVALNSFSALRHAEICRLDWAQIELSDKAGESFIEVKDFDNTKSEGRRRLVPISDNLRALLKPYAKNSGPVVPVSYARSADTLPSLVKRAGVTFKKNAFRHSGISYKVAMTGDVARVADESGNSPVVIRTNYLRRVKPAMAAEWYAIGLN